MRLRPHEVTAIKAAAVEAFGPTATVRLFGSRLRDDLRGGDVDLHLEVDEAPDLPTRSRLALALEKAVDGRKVDMVFSIRGGVLRGFERIAYRDGVVL